MSQLQVMMDFPSWLSEVANDTTKTMEDVVNVLDNNVTTTGLIYMGGLSVSDLPNNSMIQAETIIEVMKSSNGDPLYKFTLISTNVPPYMWTATGYNGRFDGWQARPTEEDLLDYVKFTNYATSNKGGVVKISSGDKGVRLTTMENAGQLIIESAKNSEILTRNNIHKPIVPSNLNFAVKSALSDKNRISDMTDEEKTNARSVIGAINKDDLTEYVKNTDYATQTKGGVVKVSTGYGLKIDELGTLMINKADQEMIDGKANETNPIVPSNLDYAVRSVLPEVQTSLPETIIKNCIYDLGEQTTLSITLPATGTVGDWLQFDFISGKTATTLTITSTSGILRFDLIPETNTVYSLYLDWGAINKIDNAITYGWRFNYVEYPLGSDKLVDANVND